MNTSKIKSKLMLVVAIATSLPLLGSCAGFFTENKADGSLMIRLESGQFQTKSSITLPDSSEFTVGVYAEDGSEIYNGTYGNLPDRLIVSPGTYNISLRTGNPDKLAFSNPVFGDDKCVIVPAGGVEEVKLLCTQINSGIRLRIASNFLTSYPKGVLFVKTAKSKLMYSYTEKRIAYFPSGEVSLMMENDGEQTNLLTKSLESREILSVSVSAPSPDAAAEEGVKSISVLIDTTRNWTGTDVVIGEQSEGSSMDEAIDVSTARVSAGRKSVWVYGYLVGAFSSSSHITFEAPFPSATNCAISGRTSASSNSSCLSVELKKGELRDAVNLVDNPDNVGRKIFLKGELVESYYGTPGIKNITEFVLK